MLLYSSCCKNKKVTRGAAWWRRTAHIYSHWPLAAHIIYTLTKSRSLSSPPPPPLCPWQIAACNPPPPPSPSISAAMLDERSEKNTSEREREREKKNKDFYDIYLFTDAHVFLHAARRCGGPKQFATTFYFECTYGEWRELARL